MKTSFLTGRFLRGYAPAYRYNAPKPAAPRGLTTARLEESFARRTRRFLGLRRRYAARLQFSGVAALLLILMAFNADLRPHEARKLLAKGQEVVPITEIIQTRQLVKPPPPPRPPVPVVVPDDDILEEEDLNLDATLDISEPLFATAPPPPPAEEAVDEEPEPEFFMIVEEMPELIGGMAALSADIVYPIIARRAGIEGMVVVQVLVDPEGEPSRPTVTKAVHEILDKAAVEAVLKQRFTPGRQRGRAVPVMMAIPVRFRLTKSV